VKEIFFTKDMPAFSDAEKYIIGDYTYGYPEILGAHLLDLLVVGKFCSIGGNVKILIEGHEHRPGWISSYPLATIFGQTPPAREESRIVNIGHCVWIGEGALIFSGARIGNGAIIGAHAVVKGVVEPYSIVAGNPAKLLRYRFDGDTIKAIEDSRWWDWPEERIKAAIPILLSADVDKLRSM